MTRFPTIRVAGIALAIVAFQQTCFGQTTIAVTEFINDVAGDENTTEWVEIYNYGPYAVNLSGWTIGDEDSDNSAIPGFSLGSGQFAILADNKAAFEAQWFGGAVTANVFEVPVITLANTTDEIRLNDAGATTRWDLAYADDETSGRATFLAVDDFSATSFGSKATPGVNRNGNDVTGNLGYESNSATADPLAVTQSGDTGSPLAGNYTAAAIGVSPFTHVLPDAGEATLIDFNDFTGAGFTPTPGAGQLDSDNFSIIGLSDGDLFFGGTQTGNDFALGETDGGVSQGGIYAFDPNSNDDRALGVQPGTSDFTPGTITLRLPNETNGIIDELNIAADILFNNDEERSNSFDIAYSTDGNNFINMVTLDSPEASDNLGFQVLPLMDTLTGLGLAPGDFLYLRVSSDDVSGSGSRDEFAIDNVQISQAAVPEPVSLAIWSAIGLMVSGVGYVRAKRRRL